MLGKTVRKNCAGAMPTGLPLLQYLVAMAPSWHLRLLLQPQLQLQLQLQLLLPLRQPLKQLLQWLHLNHQQLPPK